MTTPPDDPRLRLRYLKETGQQKEAEQYERYLNETGQGEPEIPTPPKRKITSTTTQQFGALIGRGATLGFAPKILGGIDAGGKALGKYMHGDDDAFSGFGENYAATRDKIRTAADEGIAEHPVAGRLAEFAGGVATAIPLGAAGAARSLIVEAAKRRSLAAASARIGALTGAVSGAGEATGGVGDYAKNIAIGGAAGGVIGGAIPLAARAVGAVGGTAMTALGLRPTGRSVTEAVADKALMVEPSGLEGQIAGAVKPDAVALTGGERSRIALGRVAEKFGIESAKKRALRKLVERQEYDGVTPENLVNMAKEYPDKPLAVLDGGNGNVSGLMRLAKDIPGPGRARIKKFLYDRSVGDETEGIGAGLKRVVSDVQKRIGLKPENYFARAEEMAAEQKALSKPAYDKVRDVVIDDPEVLSLFDVPAFRSVHRAVREAEGVRPNGAKIKPLSSLRDVDGSQVRVQNPQTIGTLDKTRQYLNEIARGKLDNKKIDRNMARAMLERIDAATTRLDKLHPDYGAARAGYSGRARMMDAHTEGRDEFMKLDPREIVAKIAKMPEGEADMYRRGGYDALYSTKLMKRDDGGNFGKFLQGNPDIRDRIAALAKNPDDARALGRDFRVERLVSDKKEAILGGPNSAERVIEYGETKPMTTMLGNAARVIPGLGGIAGRGIDAASQRIGAEQTRSVMNEVSRYGTMNGPDEVADFVRQWARLKGGDASRRTGRSLASGTAGGTASRSMMAGGSNITETELDAAMAAGLTDPQEVRAFVMKNRNP